jgi:hypothetical protein
MFFFLMPLAINVTLTYIVCLQVFFLSQIKLILRHFMSFHGWTKTCLGMFIFHGTDFRMKLMVNHILSQNFQDSKFYIFDLWLMCFLPSHPISTFSPNANGLFKEYIVIIIKYYLPLGMVKFFL